VNILSKPWYIVFSFFTYVFLWADLGWRFHRLRKNTSRNSHAYGELELLWFKAVGVYFSLMVGFMLAPSIIMGYIVRFIQDNHNDIWFDFMEQAPGVVLYLTGVYISYKLVAWRKKNILPLEEKIL